MYHTESEPILQYYREIESARSLMGLIRTVNIAGGYDKMAPLFEHAVS